MKIAILKNKKIPKNFQQLINLLKIEKIYYPSSLSQLIKLIKNNQIELILIHYENYSFIKKIKKTIKKPLLIVTFTSKNRIKTIKLNNKKNIPLKNILNYKNSQETFAKLKHQKIVKNELSNFFENDINIESFYCSKEILNGDSIFSIYINQNEYLLGIIDSMGKGLSASLTAINSISFLEYAVKKAIEYNDFNFKRLINDFVNYVKSILLEEESLCALLIHIKNNTLTYANFGMLPIYTLSKKYKANNNSISHNLLKFNINTIPLPQKFFILSDGLLESPLKNFQHPYYFRFIKIYKNSFIKTIIEDFQKNAIQNDDISILHLYRDKTSKTIFSQTHTISNKKDIDKILIQIFNLNIEEKNRIHYIFFELLNNTLEHQIYKYNKNTEIKISLHYENNFIKILYEEKSNGFNTEKLKTLKSKERGRGYKIIKNLSDALFFNKEGNKIKIFIRIKNDNKNKP